MGSDPTSFEPPVVDCVAPNSVVSAVWYVISKQSFAWCERGVRHRVKASRPPEWSRSLASALAGRLTPLISPPYFDRVIRLFLAALCAIGLALAPTAVLATPSAMPGCTMDGHPTRPADHSKMDCCTAACPLSAAVLLPEQTSDAASLLSNGVLHDCAPDKNLASFIASGLDPPPRLPS